MLFLLLFWGLSLRGGFAISSRSFWEPSFSSNCLPMRETMSKDCGLKWDILMELEELDKVGQRKK